MRTLSGSQAFFGAVAVALLLSVAGCGGPAALATKQASPPPVRGYAVHPLGLLRHFPNSSGLSLDSRGDVAGSATTNPFVVMGSDSGSGAPAVLYEHGRVKNLGAPPAPSALYTYSMSIFGPGSTAAAFWGHTYSGYVLRPYVARRFRGRWYWHALPAPFRTSSSVTAANASAMIAGNLGYPLFGQGRPDGIQDVRAVVWTPGRRGRYVLHVLSAPRGTSTSAHGVDSQGDVAGDVDVRRRTMAALWLSGRQLVRLPGGGYDSSARRVVVESAHGGARTLLVAGMSLASYGGQPLIWTVHVGRAHRHRFEAWSSVQRVALGANLPMFPGSSLDVNSQGLVVGTGGCSCASGRSSGFVVVDGWVQSLTSLLPPSARWVVDGATGINNRGWISATGHRVGHFRQREALLLTPRG